MIKFSAFIFALFTTNLLVAQSEITTKPELKAIEIQVNAVNSPYYYPELLKRLAAYDSTLTNVDYQNIYYGSAYQKVVPYQSKKIDTKQLAKVYAGDFNKKNLEQPILKLNQAFLDDPLDLRARNFLAYLYHVNGDVEKAKNESQAFHGLVGAILSSGDGLSCESGIHVLEVAHEYVLLNLFKMNSESQAYNGSCDVFTLEKGKFKTDALYFKINNQFESLFKN
ncbi:DUF4919 domain-containing protein [Flavobacterium agricola]|uniref:DUF4919 domain-containing protein n=1 Tax=Flavobacterium agricola TaxID=2870839 RepID=A0ABY6M034_9FLAO|nr:DUF4919 domain-containing protein [Flavobacterium agricola]UYW01910.1 DUF4919 domain-containing protein [Flavobacterium agricola]